MITVHISGGLGNQLFQYAAGLATARRTNAALRMEARKFSKHVADTDNPAARPLRILDLALPFSEICTPQEEKRLRRRWNLATNLHLPKSWLGFHTDPDHLYSPRFQKLADGICLHGYFQSEKYFAETSDDIRSAFQPRDPNLRTYVSGELAKIRRDNRPLVALHIRRGDFLNITAYVALTGHDFIDRAMAEFSGAHFLVFSDDMDWCRDHFANREDVSFSPFARVLEDFFAMAHCDHNIIAKSTFSWWAAWLNETPGRRVVAPQIAIEKKPTWGGGSPDYYPAGWTIL